MRLPDGRTPDHKPAVARTVFSGMRTLAPVAHRVTGRLSCEEDPTMLAGLPGFPEWMRHGPEQPAGAVAEYRARCRPWGFDPAGIACPVHLWQGWQGDQDGAVGVHLGRELAAMVAPVDYREIPGAGHFPAYRRWREVLAPFAGR